MEEKDANEIKITFHDRINELYERARDKNYKVGRTAFAAMCGVTKWQMNGYLSRKTEPTVSILQKIAENQNVSVSWLVGETDIPQIDSCAILVDMPMPVRNELDLVLDYLKYKHRK